MHSLQRFSRLIVISSCLFAAGVSCTQADEEKKSPATSSSDMNTMKNPMMMGQMNGMMNPHMYMNMMAQMSGMMNPMMMGGGMMTPMMGMNMMNPMMMGAMAPTMGPMSGGIGMPGMSANSGNSMTQMPGGQMMDPKQYEQWFNQMTEMRKNHSAQQQATQ